MGCFPTGAETPSHTSRGGKLPTLSWKAPWTEHVTPCTPHPEPAEWVPRPSCGRSLLAASLCFIMLNSLRCLFYSCVEFGGHSFKGAYTPSINSFPFAANVQLASLKGGKSKRNLRQPFVKGRSESTPLPFTKDPQTRTMILPEGGAVLGRDQ